MKKLPDAGSLAYSISIPADVPPGGRSLLYEEAMPVCELMLCSAPTPTDEEPDDSILEASRQIMITAFGGRKVPTDRSHTIQDG